MVRFGVPTVSGMIKYVNVKLLGQLVEYTCIKIDSVQPRLRVTKIALDILN